MSFTQALIVGPSGNTAQVNDAYEMLIASPTGLQRATLLGDAFAWNAISSDLDATDCALMVRNTSSSRLLVINRIYTWVDVATQIDIHLSTNATAFSAGGVGAAVTGVNLNTSSNKVADAGAYSDDASVTQGTLIHTLHTNETATDEFGIDYMTDDAIILGTNGCLGVDVVSEPGAAGFECTIVGYYIDV